MPDDRQDQPTELEVVDNPTEQRFEARRDGRVVAFAQYRRVRGRLVFFHTEVDPAFEGQGIGSRLAAGALDDVRAHGLTIGVKCPFIAAYLQRHPEYEDLLADRAAH
jgi:predicted GNAT family acetyltransferase